MNAARREGRYTVKRLLVLCGLAALLVVPAASAKAGLSPTVASSTNPIVLDTSFTWSGCGYTPGEVLRLQSSGLTTWGEYDTADAAGCFTSLVWSISSAFGVGSETMTVYKVTATGGKFHSVVASVTVPVVGAS